MCKPVHLSKQQIIEYVHQWGGGTVVESLLDPACHIFALDGIEGMIGYFKNNGCAVVFGDPVCSMQERAKLVEAFHAFCDQERKNVVYLVASQEFTEWMHHNYRTACMAFGKELYLNPQNDPRKCSGKKGISLRGKIRHAEKSKVEVLEYSHGSIELERQIQEIAQQWMKNKQGPQIYISPVRLFTERFGKRWFYASQEGKPVACLVLNKIEAKKGWGIDRIMTLPDAPQGTSELLVLSVMEKLAAEGCSFLTFGAVNGASLEEIRGFGKFTSFFVPFFYKVAMKMFRIKARGKYWEKFQPQCAPAFLVFKKPKVGPYETSCLLKALNVSFF